MACASSCWKTSCSSVPRRALSLALPLSANRSPSQARRRQVMAVVTPVPGVATGKVRENVSYMLVLFACGCAEQATHIVHIF
jgi:hypothetical protein